MESVFDLGRWLAMTPDQQYAHVQRLETAVLNMGQEIERLQDRLAQVRLLAEKWLRDRDPDVQAMGADLLQVLGVTE